jgi:hypothetical protein
VLKRIVILLGAISLAVGLAWGQAASTGGISGTVVNAKGTGLAAAVRVTSLGSSRQGAPIQSGADGSFTVTGLAAGLYRICATPSVPGYIESCLWRGGGPVNVTAGKTVAGRKVMVETAGTLLVQIEDPSGLLSQAAPSAANGTVAQFLMVGVLTDNKLFVSAPVTASGSTERNHAVAVPVGRNVSLRLMTHGLAVSTTAAPDTDLSGTDIPVTVAPGQASPLVFSVRGAGN